MEAKEILVIVGGAGAILWILKAIGTKLINQYFDLQKHNDELRDAMLEQQINWLKSSVQSLTAALTKNTEESQYLRIKIQSLESTINDMRTTYKETQGKNAEALLKLEKVLSYLNEKSKSTVEQMEEIGKVIRREWPEKRRG